MIIVSGFFLEPGSTSMFRNSIRPQSELLAHRDQFCGISNSTACGRCASLSRSGRPLFAS